MTTQTLDPYAVLGIPAGASSEEAARAHRRLAMEFHPDRNPGPGAAERMRRINEAWRVLSSPARRARHDAERATSAWAGPSYGARTSTQSWTTWPPPGYVATPRTRRPPRAAPVEPSFGDRPAVIAVVWTVLMLLVFIGTYLGSVSR